MTFHVSSTEALGGRGTDPPRCVPHAGTPGRAPGGRARDAVGRGQGGQWDFAAAPVPESRINEQFVTFAVPRSSSVRVCRTHSSLVLVSLLTEIVIGL